MARVGSVRAKVHQRTIHKTPAKIYDIQTAPKTGTPRRVATAFLGRIARDLKIRVAPRELRYDKTVKTVLGSHVLFQQYRKGKPVSGAWLKVDLDKDNRIYSVENTTVPAALLDKMEESATTARLDAKAAIQRAVDHLRAQAPNKRTLTLRDDATAELVFYPQKTRVVPAWKLIIPLASPLHDWRIYVHARTGEILHQEDMLKMAAARGRIFDPSPVAALNDATLKDRSKIPDNAYREVDLPEVAASGYLDGPYVNTKATRQRCRVPSRQFLFTRKQRWFKEVMVYFHIDRIQRYIQTLGFTNVNNRSISVNIDGIRDDNSFYSPATKRLTFGTGGIDDAEDAEIILHEYGHSIQDNQVPGFGASDEAGAMGEGFGDYLAASFFETLKPARFARCLGSWDATAYSPEDPPNLRRLDSTKRYPRDVVHEVHADGEIWSASLWALREAIGRTACDKLVLSHHFLLKRDSTFEEAALSLILADKQLFRGVHEKVIRTMFVRRGILKAATTKRAGYDPYARTPRPNMP
jgi:Fungalysin metallopeptidase (M36)/Fungalysin/Thermolysin Propeptide Motif